MTETSRPVITHWKLRSINAMKFSWDVFYGPVAKPIRILDFPFFFFWGAYIFYIVFFLLYIIDSFQYYNLPLDCTHVSVMLKYLVDWPALSSTDARVD